MTAKRRTARPAKPRAAVALGRLPEWNLADLYLGLDDPQVTRDLDRAMSESAAFEQEYKGKLASLVDGPQGGTALAAAIQIGRAHV